MPLPPDFLSKFNAKRRELIMLRNRIATMESEMRGWEEAAQALDPTFGADAENDGKASSPLPPRADNTPRIRRSWQTLLKETAKHYPVDVSLDDMERMSRELGDPTTRNTLRSQMSIYTTQQIVERTRQGHYRLTRTGADAIGIQLQLSPREPAPDPSSAAEPDPDNI